ncbi:MAG: tetratricopeptide repeat protein, partial [Acidimicrobiia bacterium]
TLGRRDGGAPAAGAIPTAPTGAAVPVAPGDVARLEGHLGRHPDDAGAWAALGSALVERARVTADPSLYPRAEGAFDRSLALQPEANLAALMGRGALANARHDFAAGLRWAEAALTVNPDRAEVHGVMGDALLELGRYPEAFAAFQRMVDLRPGIAAYARVSYARELQGDVEGARQALEAAATAAATPAGAAFAHHFLGELAWNTGDLAGAGRSYELAARLDPDNVAPRAGLARLHAARGETDRALSEWRSVVARAPLPEYVAEFGNLNLVAGHRAEAERQFALLDAQQLLLRSSGVNTDLEIALFNADHGVRPAEGLAAARAEWGRRQSIFVADALAWQLHANGMDAEALPLADAALRLGTRNALFHYHRGMIHRSLGHLDAARRDLGAALALNPHFSTLHAGPAARALADLDGGAR